MRGGQENTSEEIETWTLAFMERILESGVKERRGESKRSEI